MTGTWTVDRIVLLYSWEHILKYNHRTGSQCGLFRTPFVWSKRNVRHPYFLPTSVWKHILLSYYKWYSKKSTQTSISTRVLESNVQLQNTDASPYQKLVFRPSQLFLETLTKLLKSSCANLNREITGYSRQQPFRLGSLLWMRTESKTPSLLT